MRRLLIFVVVLGVVAVIAMGTRHLIKVATASTSEVIPVTKVKRGRVAVSVAARGELQGGNSEMLTAPMAGGMDMPITDLRDAGEVVEAGDVVVQFDTTQQEYNLREAESDLAEADQQVIVAEQTSLATEEESKYAMLSAKADVKMAELELRKNPLMPAIQARQNQLALDAATNREKQAEQNLVNRKKTSDAGVAIQKAAQNKAKVMAQAQQRIIESMTLKAKTAGYVNLSPNNNNMMMMYRGMSIPPFQVGDTARAGMAVAQIPDMKNWEVSANVGELDRGHLTVDQKVNVAVVALSGKAFPGHVKTLGGTTGPPWDRKFECRIALEQAGPELRPGMTSNMVITAETMDDVLWVPSQALFESDGRSFVYLKTPNGFTPHDVKLVRRSESQAVITGIAEHDLVAMSNPDQQSKPNAGGGQQNGAMKALSK